MKKYFSLLLATILCLNINAATDQTKKIDQTKKLGYAFYAIKNLYVTPVNQEKLVESAIKGMVSELDPHSAYMTKQEIEDMNEPLQGGFEGIGISFRMYKDTLMVMDVIAGGPSEKTGLLPGDKIIKVEKESIAGVKISTNDIKKRLKGKKGTIVNILVKRNKKLLPFKIVRDKIPMYSLDAAFMIDKEIGYIKLNRFGATTIQETEDALEKLKAKGMKKLILDLEMNGGGYLNAAIGIADNFLSDNKCVVFTQGLHSPKNVANSTKHGLFENGDLAILIDEYTASASEIVSGAVQDWDRGIIIGRRSFGKGLVQRTYPLPDNSVLKLTIAKYYTPSGRNIQKPYKGSDYMNDMEKRYEHGELEHRDSINLPDSLKTFTLRNHRKIYGGGGIMPDVFVPLDTTHVSDIYKKLVINGIINRFSIKYSNKNKVEIKKKFKNADKFIDEFNIDTNIFNDLISFAKSDSINFTAKDSAQDNSYLKTQIKAFITREIWSAQDFYKVMYPENETLLKAIDILKDQDKYNNILKGISSKKE